MKTRLLLLPCALAVVSFAANPAASADRIAQHLDPGLPLPTESGGGPFDATLEQIQLNVFTPSCSQSYCHGVSQAAGLHLEEDYAYASLVNVESTEVPGTNRVEPFSADASYLICKLEACPGIVNSQMPLIGGPLDQTVIDVIRLWIDNGAEATIGVDASSWGEIKASYR